MSLKPRIVAALCAVVAGLTPAAAQARWLRGESAHFVVYSHSGKRALRNYVQMLEAFDALLRRMHADISGMQTGPKLAVYLVEDPKELHQVFSEMGELTAGVYVAAPDDTFALAIRPRSEHGEFVVRHEYYHHFMKQYFPDAYPGWMIEGLAEFFSTSQVFAGKVWIGAPAYGQLDELAKGRWIPLDELIGKSVLEFSGDRRADYYDQAWLLTNYMMVDSDRRHSLNAYLLAVRRGEPPIKAWTDAVGEGPSETEKSLHAYVASRQIKGMVTSPQDEKPAEVIVVTMPSSADDMLLLGQLLKRGAPAGQQAAVLDRVRAAAARHAGDRLAELTLARAELLFGDPARAATILTRRLGADAEDQEARLLLASARMRAGDADPARRTELYREADQLLVPALKANPDDYRLLSAYAHSRAVEPGYPSANVEQIMLRAVALRPQVASLRLEAASVCEQRRDYDTAMGLLATLANDPHELAAARVAREQIEDLRKRKAGPAH